MADLMVPLYDLPEPLVPSSYEVRRPMASEGLSLQQWIAENFSRGWASEVLPGISRTPPTIFVALEKSSLLPAGFCGWDCTSLGFLGPVGVAEAHRGKGIGRAMVLYALHAMAEQGYGYAAVGYAGPVEFFRKVCGAFEIPGSTPGIYRKGLKW